MLRIAARSQKALMNRKILKFETDAAVEDFVATAGFTSHDLSGLRSKRFELECKEAHVTLRLTDSLLGAVKERGRSLPALYPRGARTRGDGEGVDGRKRTST